MNDAVRVVCFLRLLRLRCLSSLAVVFALALCGLPEPAFASRVVYRAEQEVAFVSELYLVDLAAPGEPVRLNRQLSPFSEGVGSFAVSADGARIAFSADQDAPGDHDLYLVDITAPGSWVRIGNLAPGQLELFAKFSPDGRKLAFTASDPSFADVQLYVVDLARPEEAVRVNGDLADGGSVSLTGFEFTPDGGRIVYVAGELERRYELYVVDLAAPGRSTRLNAPGGSVGDTFEGRFAIVDAGRVIYSAVGDKPGVRELHLVAIDAPAQPVTLNAPLQGGGDIFDFGLSHDGRFATYTADQDTDSLLEVFLVAIEAPGVATKLNGPVQTGVGLAAFTPDGHYVIYAGDEERRLFERDLYRVSVARPEIRVRLNAPLNGGEDIWHFSISPDGMQVAYAPEETDGFRRDLLVVGLDAPGTAVKVNGALADGALDFPPSIFSPAGEAIAFIAVESLTDSVQELFFASLSEPGRSIRLNAPLPKDAIVDPTPDSFAFLPAGAPPTGQAPPGSRPHRPGADAGGGGSVGLAAIILMLAGLAGRRRTGRARESISDSKAL